MTNVDVNRSRYRKLFKELVKRPGVDELLNYLDKTDFYIAPASTNHHHDYEGGLCKHSLEVFDRIIGREGYDMETKAIVSLGHDICKIGTYIVEMRNKKDEKGRWIQVPFYTVKDQLPLGHGEKSVFLIQSAGLQLTIEEVMAIRWHMGAYVGQQDWKVLGEAYKQYPLAMHLHFADMESTYIDSKESVDK